MNRIHKCKDSTYKYVKIYFVYDDENWYLELDKQSGIQIFYCPFCGKKLGDE